MICGEDESDGENAGPLTCMFSINESETSRSDCICSFAGVLCGFHPRGSIQDMTTRNREIYSDNHYFGMEKCRILSEIAIIGRPWW